MRRWVSKYGAAFLLCWLPLASAADEEEAAQQGGHSLTESRSAVSGAPSATDSVVTVSRSTPASGDSSSAPFAAEEAVRRFRKHPIQKVTVSGGALLSQGSNALEQGFYEVSLETAIPLGSFDNLLGVTPSFRTDFFDAVGNSAAFDVPSELFDTGVSFFHRNKFNDRLSSMIVVRPAVRSDFSTGDNAMRIFGLAMINWDYVPDRWTVSLGAVYLDRADLPALPAVGLTWTPDSRNRLELRFPESRWLTRLFKNGCHDETWGYLSAGIGGNTWAVTRTNETSDELSLRDFRLMVGIDHVIDGGGGWFFECGGAFGRRLEYENTGQEISLGSSVVLQGGWRF